MTSYPDSPLAVPRKRGFNTPVNENAGVLPHPQPARHLQSFAYDLYDGPSRSPEGHRRPRSDGNLPSLIQRVWKGLPFPGSSRSALERFDDDESGKPRHAWPFAGTEHPRTRARARWLLPAAIAAICLYCLLFAQRDRGSPGSTPRSTRPSDMAAGRKRPRLPPLAERRQVGDHPIRNGLLEVDLDNTLHPIYQLIRDARERWDAKVARQSRTLKDAMAEYRRRYKRNPPTGFDKWWEYVVEHDVQLPDEYDRIHTDLLPFHALSPRDLQTKLDRASQMPDTYVLKVRKGSIRTSVTFSTQEVHGADHRMEGQALLLRPVARWLGDLTAVYSVHDTAQVLLSWNHRQELMEHIGDDEYLDDDDEIDTTPSGWPSFCGPRSTMRTGRGMGRSSTKHGKTLVASHPALMEICDHPELVPLHGVLAGHDPRATDLIPLFSLSKTSIHADILGVPVEQWTDHRPNIAWRDRTEDALLWRGSSTGTDYSEAFPWRNTHRTRLVQLANTVEGRIARGLLDVLPLCKGEIPSAKKRNSTRTLRNGLAQIGVRRANQDWLDIKFTGNPIQCEPEECQMLRKEYPFAGLMTHEAAWKYKYIIDVDGNAWSARFQRLMGSGSLIFKSTIMPEWWTDRIEAWVHYIPIQVDYSDLYDALAFFRGDPEHREKLPGEPELAESIATEGQEWVRTHWRREDMTAYAFRLYLEWARLVSPNRKKMDMVYDESMERIRR